MANVQVTDRAVEVLRRGFAVAGLDPGSHGVRVRLAAGATRTQFADGPEPGDQEVETAGIRVFLDGALAAKALVVIDAGSEHDTITATTSD